MDYIYRVYFVELAGEPQLQSRFKKYSKIPTANGMTGRDVVEKMLRDNGVQGVKIGSVEGQLTDHYKPHEQDY